MRQTTLLRWLIIGVILLSACSEEESGEPTLPSSNVEIPHTELVFKELDEALFSYPGIPGCRLEELPPFGWKEVDSGLVVIRTPEEYARRIDSLYQEGYRAYLDNRMEFPDVYGSLPEMSYEEFLATCNVFPEVDFSQHSILGAHATGTGCNVTFEKHVVGDDQSKKILYEVVVVEEGACEMAAYSRNLILVPPIPLDYSVEFTVSAQNE